MRTIVVGVDETRVSDDALDRALVEAAVRSEALTLVRAWATPVWVGDGREPAYTVVVTPEEQARAADLLLESSLAKALARGLSTDGVTTSSLIAQGPPGAVLVECSAEASLLVVGGKGHGSLTNALLGSATSYAVHHALCPVMVVPESVETAGPYHRVVVGVDGSVGSRSALRWAHDAARHHGCPLTVLFAWQLTSGPVHVRGQAASSFQEDQALALASLRTTVTEVLPDRHGVDVHVTLVPGRTSQALLAESGAQDLLVLGARGRGGFTELLMGSVAGACVRHARGPVVVVKVGQDRT